MGVCGHYCDAWPQTNHRKTGEPMVICDHKDCDDWVMVAPTKDFVPGQLSFIPTEPEF